MDGTGYRIAAARGLAVLERAADDLLGGGVPPQWERDAATERELIRNAVRRMHRRNARRRPLVSRRS